MEKPSDHVEACAYAAVCRVPPRGRACVPASLVTASDLLVAIAHQQLHVFTRRCDRLASACGCQATSEVSASTGLLSRHGFVCPHVTSYDDVTLALTVPLNAIAQVCMTYRTTSTTASSSSSSSEEGCNTHSGKGVATRTKDLVVRTNSKLVLWLEFEHNLARGWFLEALTSAAASSLSPTSSLEIDYLDLGDDAAVAYATCQDASTRETPRSQANTPNAPLSPLAFLRDAWRHVVYEKIKLALQVAHDSPTTAVEDDPTVACLLTTAMELSTRLDEPDLNAFTWLASGFLNLRTAKQELARAQVLHSLDLAKENSLEYLTCLALQCAASAYIAQQPDTATTKARTLLTEATKWLTQSACCAAMEPALKMHLHATLHGLRDTRPSVQRAHSVLGGAGRTNTAPSSSLALAMNKLQVARSDSSSSLMGKDRKPATFSLWAHIFGGGTSTTSGVDSVKRLLLVRVEKELDETRGGSFFVDVLGAHGVHKARFRVFYGAKATTAWLLDHITARYKTAVAVSTTPDDHDSDGDPRIELLYDPQRKQLVPAQTTLREWVGEASTKELTLHAKLAPSVVSSHHRTMVSPAKQQLTHVKSLDEDAPERAASVLCSLCGTRVALSDVEDHSEACF